MMTVKRSAVVAKKAAPLRTSSHLTAKRFKRRVHTTLALIALSTRGVVTWSGYFTRRRHGTAVNTKDKTDITHQRTAIGCRRGMAHRSDAPRAENGTFSSGAGHLGLELLSYSAS